jgi:hypothetical protein
MNLPLIQIPLPNSARIASAFASLSNSIAVCIKEVEQGNVRKGELSLMK